MIVIRVQRRFHRWPGVLPGPILVLSSPRAARRQNGLSGSLLRHRGRAVPSDSGLSSPSIHCPSSRDSDYARLHRVQDTGMVTIALKSEALFAIIGVGAVVVTVCVAAALCYTCQRRGNRGSTAEGGELRAKRDGVGIVEARARAGRRPRTADVDSAESASPSKDPLAPPSDEGTAVTKIEASAFATSLNFPRFELELAHGGGLPTSSTTTTSTTTTTPSPRQPRLSQSQSTRLDPQLFQQTFSTYESFYRAQSETSAASVPPSPSPDPHAAASAGASAWPSQPAAAARTREASESRLTAVNATLADIALLPSTPTKLFMAGTGTGASSTIAAAAAAREPDRASSAMHSDTSSPLRRAASGRRRSTSVVVLPPPPAALSPRRHDLPGSEPVPPSPSPPVQIRTLPPPLTVTLAGARVPPGPAPAGGSALASRPRSRSRSVGASIIVPPPPPAYPPEALGRGQKYPPWTARSRTAVGTVHPLDGGMRLQAVGGLLGATGRPLAKSASASSASVRRRPATAPHSVRGGGGGGGPRSYFDD